MRKIPNYWGYQTDTAKDGVEGLQKIESFKPDIVLTKTNLSPKELDFLEGALAEDREAWCAKGRIPPEAHWHLFGYGLNEIQLLDASLLPEVRNIRFQRPRLAR